MHLESKSTIIDRTSLAKEISVHTPGLSEHGAGNLVDCIINEIAAGLRRSGDITVPSLGRFKVKQRAGRWGINPITKERQYWPSKTVVTFKPAARFEARVFDAA